MSIFKDTFVKPIKDQLTVRQKASQTKSPQSIQYLNSRNSWVRMSSSVNVNGSSQLAKQYVLKGGTLNTDGTLKAGLGGSTGAYSDTSPSGQKHRLGIRPMPGITGVEIKSKDAYGSLREIVVKFNCWDIRQLEDLELLYMRPGYTCLIEWGWAPYLDNDNLLRSNHKFFDILDDKNIKSKEQIFKELFLKSTVESGGNYDAMFGYVKNYNWSMRDDGGYDCTTSIISVGEIIESLKINYIPFKAPNIKTKGILNIPNTNYGAIVDIQRPYSINIMAGMFYELYHVIQQKSPKNNYNYKFVDENNVTYDFYRSNVKLVAKGEKSISNDGYQTYVTLESLVNLFNKYILVHDVKNKTPLLTLSTKERVYDKTNQTPNDLLCSAHPLQISIDPSICIIKSPIWADGFELENLPPEEEFKSFTNNPAIPPLFGDLDKLKKKKDAIPSLIGMYAGNYFRSGNQKKYKKEERDALVRDYENYKVQVENKFKLTLLTDNDKKEFMVQYYKRNKTAVGSTTDGLVDAGGGETVGKAKENLSEIMDIESILGSDDAAYDPLIYDNNVRTIKSGKIKDARNKTKTVQNLKYLKNLDKDYFYASPYSELGIIGNIYINLDYLYNLSLDPTLEQADRKDKNEINLYDFLKKIMSDVQSSTGNVNHFEIHVDPIDNHARIIDVNYVDDSNRDEVYNNAFEIQLQNTQSVVRTFSLQSQIFPEQSSLVAIGAQFGGGKIGMENNTMIDFNKNITDRIIPEKEAPAEIPNKQENQSDKIEILVTNFKILYDYFGDTATSTTENEEGKETDQDTSIAGDYKNALRDIINYFQNITVSKIGKNKNIIPVKLSLDMDGIGGLVIGHIFRIPNDILPKGYQGREGIGGRLGFALTGINHRIENSDWITHIEAQTIILDSPVDGVAFEDIMKVVSKPDGSTTTVINVNSDVAPTKISKGEVTNHVKTAIKFFKGKGFTNEQTSGIIGNLMHESGLNPGAFNSTGGNLGAYGIAQWRGERQAGLRKKYGANASKFENQLEYVYHEMVNSRKASYKSVKASKTISEAAIVFDRDFEGSEGTSRTERISYAKGVMEIIKKENAST